MANTQMDLSDCIEIIDQVMERVDSRECKKLLKQVSEYLWKLDDDIDYLITNVGKKWRELPDILNMEDVKMGKEFMGSTYIGLGLIATTLEDTQRLEGFCRQLQQ